jgi:hypothetical protein
MTSRNLTSDDSVVNKRNKTHTFDGLLSMEVTFDMIEKIQSAKFAWLDLIVQGHMIAICAKPNGGKTTIMVHAAGEMSLAGYQLMYINADASGSDIKEYTEHAIDYGYRLINPDITNGSAEKVVSELKAIASKEEDFCNSVIILDTLKKFTDMMSKQKAKELYSIFRKLTSKGMTIICLAHTNKYDDRDGKPIYEGVGDLRSDFDELIYLIPIKNPDGTMTVSTLIDKNRSIATDKSFNITADREVQVMPIHVDTLAITRERHNLAHDDEVITFILESIKDCSKTVSELHTISQELKAGFSRKRIDNVAKRYCSGSCTDPKWLSMRAATHGYRYGLISDEYADKLKKDHLDKV